MSKTAGRWYLKNAGMSAVVFAVLVGVASLAAAPSAGATPVVLDDTTPPEVVVVEPAVVPPASEAPVVPPVPDTEVPSEGTPPEIPSTETPPTEEVPGETDPEVPPVEPVPFLQMNQQGATNKAALLWTWIITQPDEETPVVIPGYGYSLFYNGTLVEQGELAADAVSFAYTATAEGLYVLNVWVLPAEPEGEIVYSEQVTIHYDLSGPVFLDEGLGFVGAVATPKLSTEETDVQYRWTVTGPEGGVAVSDTQVLTPTFTFSRDGKYTLLLTATDALGNPSTVQYTVNYTVPFVTTPETPLIPVDTTPPPVASYVKPQEARRAVVAARTALPAGDTVVTPVADAGTVTEELAMITATDDEGQVAAAAVLTPSTQGWKIIGLAWYWWLLFVAIIASAWLWVVRVIRLRRLTN